MRAAHVTVGSPYRVADPPVSEAATEDAGMNAIEAIAWIVAVGTPFLRASSSLVRPGLDAFDTSMACVSVVVVLVALGRRFGR
jgi:hypothetical protein